MLLYLSHNHKSYFLSIMYCMIANTSLPGMKQCLQAQTPSVAAKRNSAKGDLQPATRKKWRRSPVSEHKLDDTCEELKDIETSNRKESPKSTDWGHKEESKQEDLSDAVDYGDIIMESKNESDTDDNFAFASLGQSMPTQENDFLGDRCDLSLDSTNETAGEVKPKSKQRKGVVGKRMVQEASTPCPRWGHTMTMIDHKRFIVYGGQTIEKDAAKPLSDLFVYDLMEHTWTRPANCDGIARTWHTADFLPEQQLLLCFGGEVLNETTGRLTTTDQVMVLDCEIMLWYPPTVTGQVCV